MNNKKLIKYSIYFVLVPTALAASFIAGRSSRKDCSQGVMEDDAFITPSGKKGVAMNCSYGFSAGQIKCFKRASEICPSGYKVLDDNEYHFMAECK